MVDQAVVALVGDELRRIADHGELASRSQLQEAVGIGAGDLELALGELRERGEASEVEPDRFGVPVSEEERDVEGDGEGHVLPSPEQQREMLPDPLSAPGAKERGPGAWRIASHGAQVSMPRAVAGVLDAEALGKLLKAGIETAAADVTFVFEVTP